MQEKSLSDLAQSGRSKRSRSGISRNQITNLLENFDTAARRAMGTIEDQIEKDLRIFKINGMEQIFAAEDYIFTLVKPLDHRYREITNTIDTSKLNFWSVFPRKDNSLKILNSEENAE